MILFANFPKIGKRECMEEKTEGLEKSFYKNGREKTKEIFRSRSEQEKSDREIAQELVPILVKLPERKGEKVKGKNGSGQPFLQDVVFKKIASFFEICKEKNKIEWQSRKWPKYDHIGQRWKHSKIGHSDEKKKLIVIFFPNLKRIDWHGQTILNQELINYFPPIF